MEITCPCGKEFWAAPNTIGRKKYCCKSCFYKYRKIPIWNKGLKGIHLSPATEFKKGQKPWNKGVPAPESLKERWSKVKKGKRYSPQTEFKSGDKPWNKGIEYKQILWDKHPQFIDGHTKYRAHAIRNGANPICEICKTEFGWDYIHVHHKDHNRSNNNLNNLQVLCTTCHANLHKNWEKKRKFA